MQWLLQDFEDTRKLAEALGRLGIAYSWHKVVPFVGDLIPEPEVDDPDAVILFGSYILWRYAEARGLRPGVIKVKPFVDEEAWADNLLNGPGATILALRDIPDFLQGDTRQWFWRPVGDDKEEPGNVRSAEDIISLADKVLALDETEIPDGSLRHDTLMMISEPVRILREWRLWIIDGHVVTYSLYRETNVVVYRHEIDDEALQFARRMVDINPGYAPAYVMDICRTETGLKLLETNCINAAGFYAADLTTLATAIERLRLI